MIWKKVSLLALLLGICAISLTGFPACTSDTKPTTIQPTETKAQAIVNGNKDNGYPAAGALTDNAKSNFCTGTLIAPRVVLTAAHCIDAFAQLQGAIWFRIDIPVDQSSYTSIYKEIDRTATVKHPSYSAQQNNIANDIALAILKTPAFEIAPMPWNTTKMDQSYVGKDLFFMGYGRLNAASQTPAKQKYSTTLTINGVDTAGKVNTVAYAGNNTSVCQGDSGGPAMLDINGVTYVIGVTSHGTAFNCTGTSYSYRTDPYVSWIEGILKQYNTCSGATPTCGSCGSCQNDSCQPKAVSAENTNCKVCQSDADCGTGVCVTIGSGKRCAQLCDSGCCPVGHECTTDSQKRAYCLPTSMRCPPAKCTTDKDCTSTEACKNGTCVLRLPDLAKTTCQPCSSQTACGTGGYCDAPDGRGGRCLQACSQTGDLCPTGFTCKQLGPGLKQCVPKDGTCWVNCKQASDCTGGLSCIDGICQRPGGSDFGEPCDKQLKCKTGLECINIGTGGGRCYQPCGVPKGTAGAPCKEGNVCDAGLRCFSNPLGGGAVCVEPCAGGSACKNGGSCIPGINICSCQSDSQCSNGAKCNPVIPGFAGACSSATSKPCPAGEECNSTPGEASYCVRKGTGTQSVGETCNSLQRCKDGLTCVTGLGRCIEECGQGKTCTQGGACRTIAGGVSYCVCSTDADCQSDQQCQILGQGVGYCKRKETTACKPGDCPSGLVCQNGTCVPGEKPTTTEPTTSTEPSAPEPTPTKEPTGGDAGPQGNETVIGGDQTPQTEQSASEVVGKKACGCHLNASNDTPALPISFLLLLLLPFGLRKRR